MDSYIQYLQSYPNLEKALREGAIIRISRSEEGLRVVRVENKEKKPVSYGEYPYLSGALAHAESDFGLSYEEQYSGENAKHHHYDEGILPQAHDVFDQCVYGLGTDELKIFYVSMWNKFVCMRPHPEPYMERQIISGAGEDLPSAMCASFINHNVEDREFFERRMSIK